MWVRKNDGSLINLDRAEVVQPKTLAQHPAFDKGDNYRIKIVFNNHCTNLSFDSEEKRSKMLYDIGLSLMNTEKVIEQ